MYSFHFISVAVVLMAHSALSQSFFEIAAACNKENGFQGNVEALNFHDPAFPNNAKCALACLLEKKGVLKPDGSIDREMERKIPEEIITDEELKRRYMMAIDECDTSAKGEKCETAFQYIKCVKSKAGVI